MARRLTFTDVQIEQFVRKYKDGQTLSVIAKEAKCSVPSMSRLLSKHTTLRPKGRRPTLPEMEPEPKQQSFNFAKADEEAPPKPLKRRVVGVD